MQCGERRVWSCRVGCIREERCTCLCRVGGVRDRGQGVAPPTLHVIYVCTLCLHAVLPEYVYVYTVAAVIPIANYNYLE